MIVGNVWAIVSSFVEIDCGIVWSVMPRYCVLKKRGQEKEERLHPLPKVNDVVSMPMSRFRLKAGCIAWNRRDGSDALKEGLKTILGSSLANNSIRPFGRDLKNWEIEEVKKGNAGKSLRKAGKRALSDEIRLERQGKKEKRVAKQQAQKTASHTEFPMATVLAVAKDPPKRRLDWEAQAETNLEDSVTRFDEYVSEREQFQIQRHHKAPSKQRRISNGPYKSLVEERRVNLLQKIQKESRKRKQDAKHKKSNRIDEQAKRFAEGGVSIGEQGHYSIEDDPRSSERYLTKSLHQPSSGGGRFLLVRDAESPHVYSAMDQDGLPLVFENIVPPNDRCQTPDYDADTPLYEADEPVGSTWAASDLENSQIQLDLQNFEHYQAQAQPGRPPHEQNHTHKVYPIPNAMHDSIDQESWSFMDPLAEWMRDSKNNYSAAPINDSRASSGGHLAAECEADLNTNKHSQISGRRDRDTDRDLESEHHAPKAKRLCGPRPPNCALSLTPSTTRVGGRKRPKSGSQRHRNLPQQIRHLQE